MNKWKIFSIILILVFLSFCLVIYFKFYYKQIIVCTYKDNNVNHSLSFYFKNNSIMDYYGNYYEGQKDNDSEFIYFINNSMGSIGFDESYNSSKIENCENYVDNIRINRKTLEFDISRNYCNHCSKVIDNYEGHCFKTNNFKKF